MSMVNLENCKKIIGDTEISKGIKILSASDE